jgi:hypothetical protein
MVEHDLYSHAACFLNMLLYIYLYAICSPIAHHENRAKPNSPTFHVKAVVHDAQ